MIHFRYPLIPQAMWLAPKLELPPQHPEGKDLRASENSQRVPKQTPLFQLRGLSKSYATPNGAVTVLENVDATIHEGMTSLVGPSGCGKTTLMNLLGGLDRPTRGNILYRGEPIPYTSESALRMFRQHEVGWVFQQSNLVNHQTLVENAALPLLLRGTMRQMALEQAAHWLRQLGLKDSQFHRKPAEVSGGEQQRCAIARAFTAPSRVILADEPTGSLDPENATNVMAALATVAREAGRPVVLVTHNHDLARRHADRIVTCSRFGLQ